MTRILLTLSLAALTLTGLAQSRQSVMVDGTTLRLVTHTNLWRSNATAIASAVTPFLPTNPPSSGGSGTGTATSVATFNADNSGATDCTAAIDAAQIACATNGYEVFFPPGIYKHNTVMRSRVKFRGAGGTVRYDWTDEISNATRFRAADPAKPIILIGQYSGSPQFPLMGQEIRDIGFDGQGNATCGVVISNYFSGSSQYAGNGCIVEGNAFQRFLKYGFQNIAGGSVDLRQNCLMNSPTNVSWQAATSGDWPDAGSFRNNVIGGSKYLGTTNGVNLDLQAGMGHVYDGGDIGNNRLHIALGACTLTVVSGNFETCWGTHFIENYNGRLKLVNTQFRHTQAGAHTSATFVRHTSANGSDNIDCASIFNVDHQGDCVGFPAWEGVPTAPRPIISAYTGVEMSYRWATDGNFTSFGECHWVRTPNVQALGTKGKFLAFGEDGVIVESNAPSGGGLSSPVPWSAMSNNTSETLFVSSGSVDIHGAGTGHVTFGNMSGAPEYGTISLWGAASPMTAGAYSFASSPDDKNLYINAPSGKYIYLTLDGTSYLTITPQGWVSMPGGILIFGGKTATWQTNTISGTEIRYLGN